MVNPIQPESPIPMPAPCHVSTAPSSDQLNADITHEEVDAALKRLKRNKAGFDGIEAEFILDATDLLVTPLVLTFNQILDKGVSPSWCIGLIHPFHKAGDRDDPGIHRGITVFVILYNFYAMILEARATAWAEESKCRARGQAGFRQDHRTIDQLFIIRTLLQQSAHAKLVRLSVSFIVASWTSRRPLIWFPMMPYGMC